MRAGKNHLTVIIGGVDRSRDWDAVARSGGRFHVLAISGCVAVLIATAALSRAVLEQHVSEASPAISAQSVPVAPASEYFPSDYVNSAAAPEPHIQAF